MMTADYFGCGSKIKTPRLKDISAFAYFNCFRLFFFPYVNFTFLVYSKSTRKREIVTVRVYIFFSKGEITISPD